MLADLHVRGQEYAADVASNWFEGDIAGYVSRFEAEKARVLRPKVLRSTPK